MRLLPPAVDLANHGIHRLKLFEQGLPVRGQPVTCLAAQEQLTADILLEIEHTPPDRRGTEAACLTGSSQAAMARDGKKNLIGIPAYVFHK